jgi:hypothetical protein
MERADTRHQGWYSCYRLSGCRLVTLWQWGSISSRTALQDRERSRTICALMATAAVVPLLAYGALSIYSRNSGARTTVVQVQNIARSSADRSIGVSGSVRTSGHSQPTFRTPVFPGKGASSELRPAVPRLRRAHAIEEHGVTGHEQRQTSTVTIPGPESARCSTF